MAAITAPALTPTVEERSALSWAVADAITIAWRNLKAMSRTPEVIMFSTIQPIIFVLTFRYVFGVSITLPGNLPYVDFLMPGVTKASSNGSARYPWPDPRCSLVARSPTWCATSASC
jgi:hypothetical protein